MQPPLAAIASIVQRYRVQTLLVGGASAAARFDHDEEIAVVVRWLESKHVAAGSDSRREPAK